MYPIPRRLLARVQNHERYERDPVGYAEKVLHVDWWHVQKQIALALLDPPYKVIALASTAVGKTHLAGGLINWWYDSRPRDSVVLTTGPANREVADLTWREVRAQRGDRGGFRGSSSPELFDNVNHYAKGYSTNKSESFKGRHPLHMFFLLEEAAGIKSFVWRNIKTMFQPTGNHAILVIGNPTDTTSEMYAESQREGWTVINMAATDHPNIAAELSGEPAPYPSAVRLSQVNEQLKSWCTPIGETEKLATDLEWPPRSGKWLRPGPEAESLVLGRWPSSATYGVWSDMLWRAAERSGVDPLTYHTQETLQLGCDVARHGDDWTAIHVRWGCCSLAHERGNGWDTVRTAGRLMELARLYARLKCGEAAWDSNPDERWREAHAHRVPIAVDDTGVGGGVTDILNANGFLAVPVNAACVAAADLMYPDVRSELWFTVAERAKQGALDVSRLDSETRRRLQVQALAPEWAPDARGRRRLEPKSKTKERCQGRSPDDLDALNLAFYPHGQAVPQVHKASERPTVMQRDRERVRSRLFRGRG